MKTKADRWWDTYNAALTGFITAAFDGDHDWHADLHECAVRQANAAHGPLADAVEEDRYARSIAEEP